MGSGRGTERRTERAVSGVRLSPSVTRRGRDAPRVEPPVGAPRAGPSGGAAGRRCGDRPAYPLSPTREASDCADPAPDTSTRAGWRGGEPRSGRRRSAAPEAARSVGGTQNGAGRSGNPGDVSTAAGEPRGRGAQRAAGVERSGAFSPPHSPPETQRSHRQRATIGIQAFVSCQPSNPCGKLHRFAHITSSSPPTGKAQIAQR